MIKALLCYAGLLVLDGLVTDVLTLGPLNLFCFAIVAGAFGIFVFAYDWD